MAWRRRPWSHFNVSGLVDTRWLRRDRRVAGYRCYKRRRGGRQGYSIEFSRVYIERTDADQSDRAVAVEGSCRAPSGSCATRAGVGTIRMLRCVSHDVVMTYIAGVLCQPLLPVGTRPRPTCALRPSKNARTDTEWGGNRTGLPDETSGSPLAPEGYRYFTTWDTEGSQTRRPGHPVGPGGTTTGGVAPDHRARRGVLADSGAETAFPVTHGWPGARAAQRRPGAGHQS